MTAGGGARPVPSSIITGRLVLAAVLVGVLGAATAVLVRGALSLGLEAIYGTRDVTLGLAAQGWPVRLVLPALGGLVGGGVAWLLSRRGSQGVADVMEAVAIGRGRPRLKHAIGPTLGSIGAALGGGSIGREGPLIQLGAAMGDLVGHPPRRLRLRVLPELSERERRALVAAGTAAGFAAAYNTPLAGILFVLEVMLGVVTLDVLAPVAIATAVGTLITRALAGEGPIYGAREFGLGSGVELAAFAVVGLVAALGGVGFMRLLETGERLFAKLSWKRPLRAALGGLIVGAIAVALPSVAGNGYEPLNLLLDGRVAWLMVLGLALAKAVATTASVTSGSPGGVFTPTMLIGASLGHVVGMLAAAAGLASPHQIGGYVLVGMAAALSATTHAPLMATVLAFELSGDYQIVLPLLVGTGVALLLSRRLSKDSMYTAELRRRGLPAEASLGERVARGIKARDVMEAVPAQVPAHTPLAEALDRLAEGRGRLLYVTDDGPLRAISLTTAKAFWRGLMRGVPLPEGATAGDVARGVIAAIPDDSLVSLGEKLFAVDWGELPVVDPQRPQIPLGVVTRRALLGAFDRELLQRDALMTQVVSRGGERTEYLELPDGHRAAIVPAPPWMIGTSPDAAMLRGRFGVTLIAIRKDAGDNAPPRWHDPDPEVVVGPADRLMLVATEQELERLSQRP